MVSDDELAALCTAVDAAEAVHAHGAFTVDFHLSPGGTFAVRARPALPPPLIALFARDFGKTRLVFALSDQERVVDAIVPAFAPRASVRTVPADVVRAVGGARERARTGALGASKSAVRGVVGEELWGRLHQFQRDGVVSGVKMGRFVLADDMGMGKTVSALTVAEYYRRSAGGEERAPVLVLCPSSVRDMWVAEISRWVEVDSKAVHCVCSSKDARRLLKKRALGTRDPWDAQIDVAYVVCSYDLVPRLVAELSEGKGEREGSGESGGRGQKADAWGEGGEDYTAPEVLQYQPINLPIELSMFGTVIADECHSLKNMGTVRARACVPVILAADYRILVSGTPVMSRPSELFTQLQCIYGAGPEAPPFLSANFFEEHYCGGSYMDGGAASNMIELNALLAEVMVRRSKTDAKLALPPKIRSHFNVQLCQKSLGEFAENLAQLSERRGEKEGAIAEGGDALARLTARLGRFNRMLLQKTCEAKISGVLTRLRQMLEVKAGEPKKILLFAYHQIMLNAAENMCRERGHRYIRLDGNTNASHRSGVVAQFQSEAGIRVAILSIRVAGVGLTMTKANTILFAELDWVPANLAQAEDRAHRIGRVGPLHIEYAVARGTLDDSMWPSVRRKLGMVGMLVDGVGHNRNCLDPESMGPTLEQNGTEVRATVLAASTDFSGFDSSQDVGEGGEKGKQQTQTCSQRSSLAAEELPTPKRRRLATPSIASW